MSNILRIGDKIKIVVPKLFVRCGYPLSRDDMAEKYNAEISLKVHKAAVAAEIDMNDSMVYNLLSRAIASDYLRKAKFGGNERVIIEEDNEWNQRLKGEKGVVVAMKSVQTGKYERGYYSRNWDGEGDYEPAYLSGVKIHRVLEIDLDNCLKVKILAKNCEKVD